jgi:hypothetical protein
MSTRSLNTFEPPPVKCEQFIVCRGCYVALTYLTYLVPKELRGYLNYSQAGLEINQNFFFSSSQCSIVSNSCRVFQPVNARLLMAFVPNPLRLPGTDRRRSLTLCRILSVRLLPVKAKTILENSKRFVDSERDILL